MIEVTKLFFIALVNVHGSGGNANTAPPGTTATNKSDNRNSNVHVQQVVVIVDDDDNNIAFLFLSHE